MGKTGFSRKPRLSSHARLVLARRYLRKDAGNRVIETPADMLARVARTVAAADKAYGAGPGEILELAESFYEAMAALDFLPNSPTLMNAGRELGQLAACFVLPVEDSIESIFNAVRDTAVIHKSGGGTGFSFSAVRPARDIVKTTHGVSSGPITFMNVFDVATETIKQGGVRRGANMGILSVRHPDILEFIRIKAEHPDRLTNFNLSVSVPDQFMHAVLNKEKYELVNPHQRDDSAISVVRLLPAAEVFDLMARSAWRCGDPGLVFIDRINAANPLPHLGPMEATNPCGEQPLLPYESCTLGSINLGRFVRGRGVDYGRLAKMVRLAVHFLDNVIDVNIYPLPAIRAVTLANRKIGLGVMGLADLLIRLGIRYDSDDALELCGELMAFIQREAREASKDLARIRGNFPSFIGSRYEADGLTHMRNATVTTIAPTGTLSIIAGCSSGIEPLYALAYKRRVLNDEELLEVNPMFRDLARRRGFWSESLAAGLAESGTAAGLPGVPDGVAGLFVTAHDIEPEWHIRIQAVFQKYTDNAVSKTINLPYTATPEDVRRIFLMAWESGLKGVTVYRDGSRDRQVLSFGRPGESAPSRRRPAGAGSCPECGTLLEKRSGCALCPECGYSSCD